MLHHTQTGNTTNKEEAEYVSCHFKQSVLIEIPEKLVFAGGRQR